MIKIIKSIYFKLKYFQFIVFKKRGYQKSLLSINLCCGGQRIPGYFNIDINNGVDLTLDLSKKNIPFDNNRCSSVICISAINYFSYSRAQEIVSEVFRILRSGGIARFGVQDLEAITKRYVEKDTAFFFQKTLLGQERFEGKTLGDKFVAWFYGYVAGGSPCKYFYDYESLALLFKNAGFSIIERKQYLESRLDNINMIDNRPDQMFFLEAVK